MILVDSSGLLSILFPDLKHHRACGEALTRSTAPRVLSPFVLAELDYLVTKFVGATAALAVLDEVHRGVYDLASFDSEDVGEAMSVMDSFSDLKIGLADASLVVLSRRLRVTDVLTLDQRHFRVLRGYRDRPFRILPADA